MVVRSSDEEAEYVRPHEVDRVLRLAPRTVIRWADHGWLSDSVILSGHRRIRGKDVEALVKRMKRQKDVRD